MDSSPEEVGLQSSSTDGDDHSSRDRGHYELDTVDDLRTPAQKVRNLLTGGLEDEISNFRSLSNHILYIQLDVLCHFDDDNVGWKEISRWLKYEEKVEAGGRWSKPHVTTASLHALFELRHVFVEEECSTIALDVDVGSGSLRDIIDVISDITARSQKLSDVDTQNLKQILLSPHKHKHRHSRKTGKFSSSSGGRKGLCHNNQNNTNNCVKRNDVSKIDASKIGQPRRRSLIRKEGKDLWTIYTSYPKGTTPENLLPYQSNSQLMRKLRPGTEGASILIGQVDFFDKPFLGFFRLRSACVLDDLTEVSVLVRFVVVILGPEHSISMMEYTEIGRALALLFTDKVFCEVAYKATCRMDLIDGIDEFMDELTVLPPSIWDPSIRLEPPTNTRKLEDIWCRLNDIDRHHMKFDCLQITDVGSADISLYRSGRLFGGLMLDMRRRYSQYFSDIRDGFHIQCLSSIVFLYFACITPIVTFGGLLGQHTNGYMGTMEMLVSGAVCGVIFSIFAGQPLIIVGATGPLMVFESIVYQLCHEYDVDFLSTRFWIGAWVFLFLMILVALDLSCLVRYITRFTEESFTVLIAVIFIYEAFAKLTRIWHMSPIGLGPGHANPHCYCMLNAMTENDTYVNVTHLREPNDDVTTDVTMMDSTFLNWSRQLPEDCITYRYRVIVRTGCLQKMACVARNWTLVGSGCEMSAVTESIPDVFLLSCVLLCGTFSFAWFIRGLRNSTYFPTMVRRVIADFAVLMAVFVWTGVDFYFDLPTPKLRVPSQFKPTRTDRSWLVNPGIMLKSHWWLIFALAIPGILATVLIFLDQQITAVIVNRKEHKLKKGHGYHLDLFVLSFLIAFCSLFGLPWFVAATVRAITHVRSLICESEAQAPGDKPHMLGIREQRVTGVCIHLLIGLSAFFTSVLKHVPMPVLYGVFLYMGITSLVGVQFVERIQILFMPIKFQPDYIYLRHVKTSHVHYFTLLQLVCSATMWLVKSVKTISIAFPLMLVVLVGVRKLMDLLFSQRDLFWLDNLLPEDHRRKQEDEAKANEKTEIADNTDEEIGFGGYEDEKITENNGCLPQGTFGNDIKLEPKQDEQLQPCFTLYQPAP